MQGDTDKNQKKEPKLVYRYMVADIDGYPKIGPKYAHLGVRPNKDIDVEKDGSVGSLFPLAVEKGLSTNRYPTNDFKNPSAYTIYSLDVSSLPFGLKHKFDGPNHGVLYPSYNMSLENFQTILGLTRYSWNPIK